MPQVTPIPAFSDNYIWMLRDGTRCHVVDPGDADPVLDELAREGLSLASILITHHHFDHVGGLLELKRATGCEVFGPDNPAIKGIDHVLGDGDSVEVGSYRFEVIKVPGHTLDHIAYFCPAGAGDPPRLFCGDTLFAAGCGRIFEGDPQTMHRSLSRLAALPGETLVYCAHEYTLANLAFARAAEPDNRLLAEREVADRDKRERGEPTVPSTIAAERNTNPFLRSAEPAVMATLRDRGVLEEDDPVLAFAALRAWKDTF